ncbi:COG2968 Uncharacterized conserved protein [Candidatus Nanopelagicaceae bacterium]
MTTSTIKKTLLLVTPLALIAAFLVPTSANAATATRYITVSAEGTVKVAPDAVRLTATVSVVSTTNKEALAATSTSAAAVRKALIASGISTKDIATQNITAYPEYKYDNGGSTLVGYRGSQVFSVVIRAAANAGAVVDAVVAAGGDAAQINSVSPFVLDAAKAAESARAVAVKNAKAKAASYAKLLGVKLGKVNNLTENGSPSISAPIFVASAKAEADAATVVDLGQQDVTVSVTVQWAI